MAKMKGKTVLITGGAAGIGLCTAENFAKAGSKLILTDLNPDALEAAKAKLGAYGIPVATYQVDVSDREQVEAMAADIEAKHGGIDILINNAGIGYSGELADTTLDTWRKLVDVNFWGPLYHIYAFLPALKKRGGGRIVNVSSGQAFLQLPTWGAYSAIKAALGVFSEVLHWELRSHKIAVTTVYPYMVNTGFYNGVEGDTFAGKLVMKLLPLYSQSPETVGRIIYNATRKGTRVETVSVFNSLFKVARFVTPVGNTVSFVANHFLSKSPENGDAADQAT